ncbi:ribonuclease H family protein [Virgibacillus senegalensis]|uniref:ribonuclease H family protein n=1 Tax=Virgibacillus senegalensis TaxID=1499679 RepID=UPI00069CC370|nr:ribonuclease H family protein [Virgibacillus senegalensis]
MDIRIEMTYQTPKGTAVNFISEEMNPGKAILMAEDLERTGRAKQMTFLDSRDSTWTLKELKKYTEEIKTEPHFISVYFDGGFDRESQSAGLGCAVYYEQNGKSLRLRKNAQVDELETNNEAEYAAFHLALQELALMEVHDLPVTIIGDSQVVIRQLTGEWPCYEEELSKWIDRIENMLEELGIDPSYQLVSRKLNKEADQLASQALRGIAITGTSEVKK